MSSRNGRRINEAVSTAVEIYTFWSALTEDMPKALRKSVTEIYTHALLNDSADWDGSVSAIGFRIEPERNEDDE